MRAYRKDHGDPHCEWKERHEQQALAAAGRLALLVPAFERKQSLIIIIIRVVLAPQAAATTHL